MKYPHVLALGVFDLFHIGHLRYLQFARQRGDFLSVAVSPDAMSLATKHKLPVIPEQQRIEMIRGLGWVDAVAMQPASTLMTEEAAEWIAQWGINHVVAGGGWIGSPRWTKLAPLLAERGISMEFAPETKGISTSDIVAAIKSSATNL